MQLPAGAMQNAQNIFSEVGLGTGGQAQTIGTGQQGFGAGTQQGYDVGQPSGMGTGQPGMGTGQPGYVERQQPGYGERQVPVTPGTPEQPPPVNP